MTLLVVWIAPSLTGLAKSGKVPAAAIVSDLSSWMDAFVTSAYIPDFMGVLTKPQKPEMTFCSPRLSHDCPKCQNVGVMSRF